MLRKFQGQKVPEYSHGKFHAFSGMFGSKKMPKIIMAIGWIALLIFTGMVVWAGQDMNVREGFAWLLSTPWGVTTVVDLYLCFALIACWMAAVEENRKTVPFWVVSIFFLGSALMLIYLIKRCWGAQSFEEIFLGRRIS